MKLTKITVYGLFGEYDYEIPLCKDGLTYIHSPNGMGKSTVMRLVADILSGNLEEVRTVAFERLDLSFDNASSIYVECYNQELKVQVSRNEIEEEISVDDLSKILKCTYIGPERTYTEDAEGNTVPALKLYMRQLADSIRTAMADTRIEIGEKPVQKMTDADVDKIFKDCLARIDFIKQAGLNPIYPSGYRFPPSRYEISQFPDDYRAIAKSLKDWTDKYYGFAESVVVFKDIINSIFVNKTVEFNEAGFIEARMDRSNCTVPLDKFSSGEKQVIIMFYELLFCSPIGSLAIIDEPEVSLHVTWQQQLGKMFKDVARLRELTLIVATHAPAVIHDDWDNAVEICNTRV